MARRQTLDDWEEQVEQKRAVKKRPKAPADLPDEKQVWLTPKESAAYLGLGLSTLAKMRMAMSGPRWSQPLPNAVRYSKRALDDWMRSQEVPQAAE